VSESPSPPAGTAGEARSYGPSSVAARPAEATMSISQTGSMSMSPAQSSTTTPIAKPPTGPNGLGGGPIGAGAPDGLSGPGTSAVGTGPGTGAGGSGGPVSPRQVAAKSFARLGSMVNDTVASVRPSSSQVGPQVRVRKARLRVARIDPWSVMKVSFVLSIAMGIVTMVATAVIWKVLESLGVFSSLNKTIGDLTSSGTGSTSTSFSVTSFASFTHVEGFVILISLVDIVLITALSTLGAYLYNLASGFVGGFEVTLAEDQ
jgi:Transmembrane domain of unknown function (DUF3566)